MTNDKCRIKEHFLLDFKKSSVVCGVHAAKALALQAGMCCMRDFYNSSIVIRHFSAVRFFNV